MICSQNTALRILTTAVTVLLVCAVAIIHGSFWADFLVGMALGLSIAILCLVWSNQPAQDDRSDDGRTIQLSLPR